MSKPFLWLWLPGKSAIVEKQLNKIIHTPGGNLVFNCYCVPLVHSIPSVLSTRYGSVSSLNLSSFLYLNISYGIEITVFGISFIVSCKKFNPSLT